MHIVITDGQTLNPGDLSWSWLSTYGTYQVYNRTQPEPEQYLERCQKANVLIINKSGLVLGAELFVKLPNLKLILVAATGYNIIDTHAARQHNIAVCNVPSYGTNTVAQHTWALILELANRVGEHGRSVSQGAWLNATDWCYTIAPITELAGKTLGIIGFGNIGQKVAQIGSAFGMEVLFCSSSSKKNDLGSQISLDLLLQKSDIVSLHCPANNQTTQMVNSSFLSKMKTSAYLINTSRGQLICEADLANALNTSTIAAAALDVLSAEPPQPHNPLLSAANCLITPHNAWIAIEARQRIMETLEQNLKNFLNNTPQNVVN
jgi:glycerate dehydrogenase